MENKKKINKKYKSATNTRQLYIQVLVLEEPPGGYIHGVSW